jgi:hypothetical protein
MNLYFASLNPNKVVCMHVFLINTPIVSMSDFYMEINIKNNRSGDVMLLDCFFSLNVVSRTCPLCVFRCYVKSLNFDY